MLINQKILLNIKYYLESLGKAESKFYTKDGLEPVFNNEGKIDINNFTQNAEENMKFMAIM